MSNPNMSPPRASILPLVVAVISVCALTGFLSSTHLDSIESRILQPRHVLELLFQHSLAALGSTLLVTIIGVGGGIVVTRSWARKVASPTTSLLNIGQAVPDIGILVLLALVIGLEPETLLITLVLYTVLPVLRNTITGLQETPASVLDAARGQGFTTSQVLWRVELPLAVPAILAGIRTALLLGIGVATIGAFIAVGGLGELIVDGVAANRSPVLITGSVLVAALALVMDYVASTAERMLRPRGLEIAH